MNEETEVVREDVKATELKLTGDRKNDLRMLVRFFYDMQKLRIAAGVRSSSEPAELRDQDQDILSQASDRLHGIEQMVLKEIKKLLKGVPIYDEWLKDQRGIGPTLAGVIVSSIDISRCNTASALWRFCGCACVIDPETGRGISERRKRGEKLHYNPWLKAKLLKIMGDCLIRANSPYKNFYANYKFRKESQRGPCTNCKGTGWKVLKADELAEFPERSELEAAKQEALDAKREKRADKKKPGAPCLNCEGTGIGPWGNSKIHRHEAARRYMVKMFLLDLWKKWRELEGLEVRVPYAEQYLGVKHHGPSAIERAAD